MEADSEKGRELVEEGWQAQKKAYRRALEKLQEFFEETENPMEVIEDTHNDLIRHQMYKLGRYEGYPVFLYDNYGAGLTTKKDLDRALEAPNSENQKVWIVPADVHL